MTYRHRKIDKKKVVGKTELTCNEMVTIVTKWKVV